MNKETLEEAAEKYNDDFQIKGGSKAPHIKNVHLMYHFTKGAEWAQERMYSEEEVTKLLISCKDRFGGSDLYDYTHDNEVKEWFEQFKKGIKD